jgi:hypothetical protein
MMTKLLVGLFGAAVIATGGYAAASGLDTDPARTVSLPGATNGVTGTTTGATTTDDADDDAGDVSGPCDEAEHRNDPRCTGAASLDDDGDDDRSGRGGDDDREDDENDDDDRSGSNSGRG